VILIIQNSQSVSIIRIRVSPYYSNNSSNKVILLFRTVRGDTIVVSPSSRVLVIIVITMTCGYQSSTHSVAIFISRLIAAQEG